ncbi:hypothetical protein [Massilia sp. DD77]|uniref:hypothetical protein n=1 Tax=Massilia sp. DD77 TaxID=3109349 RepID=UPI002FFFE947
MSFTDLSDHRFMVSPDGHQSDWFEPAEIVRCCPGWTDCTELNDAELGAFIVRRMLAAAQGSAAPLLLAA